MSLMLPTSPVSRALRSKPVEGEIPVHMHRSYYDFVEAQIVDHLIQNESVNGAMISGRTAMEMVFDTVIDGNISVDECLRLVTFLRQQQCKIPVEEGGQLLLNRVLRCTGMRLSDKVQLGEYLLEKGGSNRTAQDKDVREDALFAAVADPASASEVVNMLLTTQPGDPTEFAKKTVNSTGETVLSKLVVHLGGVADPKTIESIQQTIVTLCGEASMEPGDLIPALVQAAGHRVMICTQMLEFIKDELGDLVDFNALTGELEQSGTHIAAANGQHSILRTLVNCDAEIDVGDGKGDTPLILACRAGHTKSMAVLLGEGANPNTKSEIDGSPLQSAVVGGRVAVVEELFRNNKCIDLDPGVLDSDETVEQKYWPIGINEPDKESNTPLDVVIQAEQAESPPPENAEMCKLLLASNAKTASTGPLHQLIKQVCNSDDLSHQDRMRNAAVVVMLLDANDGEKKLIDPNDKVDGVTPLDLLVWKPVGNIMQALLRAGAVLEEGLIQRMLRGMASEDCTQEKFDRLLESIAILTENQGAPVGEDKLPCTQSPEGEPTLLQLAIKLKLKEVVDVLVTNGADVNHGSPVFHALKMFSKAYLTSDDNTAVRIREIIAILFEAGNLDCNRPADEELNEERTLLEIVTSEDVNDEELRDLVLGKPGEPCHLNAIPNQPSDNPVLGELMSELLLNKDMDPGRVHFVLDTVDKLIHCGANVDLMVDGLEKTTTPLKIAIQLSEWNLATTMIQVGNADINFLDPFHENVLVPFCASDVQDEKRPFLQEMLNVFFVNGADAATVNSGDPCSFDIAWKTQNFDLAQKLVKKGANFNHTNSIFRIMQTIAAYKLEGDMEQVAALMDLVRFLISSGALVNTIDPESQKSGLGFAISIEDISLVEMLLDEAGADAKEEGMLGSVFVAIVNEVAMGAHGSDRFSFLEHVALLLMNSGADPRTAIQGDPDSDKPSGEQPDWVERFEWTCVDHAISASSEDLLTETVSRLSENMRRGGALLGKSLSNVFEDLKLLKETDQNANVNELIYGPAVTYSFLQNAMMLLSGKGALNYMPKTCEFTPFETALKLSDENLCSFLVEHDADLTTHAPLLQLFEEYYTSDDYKTYWAPESERNTFVFAMTRVIMENNMAFCDSVGLSGKSSLQLAIANYDIQTATLMIDGGADINERNILCFVLDMVVKGVPRKPQQFYELIDKLIKAGAELNPEIKDNKQHPLQYAVVLRDVPLITLMVEGGADVNASPLLPISVQHYCDSGNLPPEDAEEERVFHAELILLLLENEADVEQLGPRGMTGFQVAFEFENTEQMQALLKKDAKFPEDLLLDVLRNLRSKYDPRSNSGAEVEELMAHMLIEHKADVNVCRDEVEPLELAVESLHEDMVKCLIQAGANLRDEHAGNPLFAAFNPLHHAVSQDNEKIVRKCSIVADYLIEKGADPHCLHQVLDMCFEANDSDQLIVGMLTFFGNKGARLNEEHDEGPLLMRCARKGLALSVDALIELGAPVRQKRKVDDRTALAEAIAHQNSQCAAILLEAGADAKELKGENGVPMLHQSVLHKEVVLLQLMAKSSSVCVKNMTDQFERTVLHYVLCQEISQNNGDLQQMLNAIGKFADPCAADSQGDTAMHIAVAAHPVETVNQILQLKGADVNRSNSRGWSPLDVAAIRGDIDIFKATLAHYPKGRSVKPETVALCAASSFMKGLESCATEGVETWDLSLWTAAFMGRLDSMVFAIQQGADVNQRDSERRTILHWLSSWHSRNPSYVSTLAKPLLDSKANPLLTDGNGATPMHAACLFHNVPFVKLLLEFGASVKSTDDNGFKAINPSTIVGADEVIKAMEVVQDDIPPESQMFRDLETDIGWGLLTQRPNYRPERFAAIEWRRVSEFKPSSQLANDPDLMLAENVSLAKSHIDSFTASLMQGSFGINLSEFFVTKVASPNGKYVLQLPTLSDPSKLVEVVVDDIVPCIEGSPCFIGLAKDGTFWPVILRKGFAKLWGTYDAPPPEFVNVEDPSKPRGRLRSSEEVRLSTSAVLQGLAHVFGCLPQHAPHPTFGNVVVKLPQAHYMEPEQITPRPFWHTWLTNMRSYHLQNVAQITVDSKSHDVTNDPSFFVMLWQQPTDGTDLLFVQHASSDSASEKRISLDVDPSLEYVLGLFECDGTAGLWGVRPSTWGSKCLYLS